jgi:hypothetical protein
MSALTMQVLGQKNTAFAGTGGVSAANGSLGFRPAFMDTETCAVYVSCFADGRPAPRHLLDGLPDEAIAARTPSGRVSMLKPSIVSGFLSRNRFYTRDEAAREVAERVAA